MHKTLHLIPWKEIIDFLSNTVFTVNRKGTIFFHTCKIDLKEESSIISFLLTVKIDLIFDFVYFIITKQNQIEYHGV